MNSLSRTLTVTSSIRQSSELEVITMQLTLPNIKNKISELIERLKKAPSINLNVITHLENNIHPIFSDISSLERRDRVIFELCELYDAILQAIMFEKKPKNKSKLLIFREEIKALINEIVPRGKSIEAYIKEYNILKAERNAMSIVVQRANSVQKNILFATANRENQLLRKSFEKTKKRIGELLSKKEMLTKDLQSQAEALAIKSDIISRQLLESIMQTQPLCSILEEQNKNLIAFFDESESVLKGF